MLFMMASTILLANIIKELLQFCFAHRLPLIKIPTTLIWIRRVELVAINMYMFSEIQGRWDEITERVHQSRNEAFLRKDDLKA